MTAPRRIVRAAVALTAMALWTGACGGGPAASEATIDREAFVATYVDLRLSALGATSGEITDAERARVLDKHGVTEDDLLSFADAYGPDPAAMKEVWDSVRVRLQVAAGEDLEAEDGAAR